MIDPRTGHTGTLATIDQLTDFTDAWLANRPLSDSTRAAYRRDVHQYLAWSHAAGLYPLAVHWTHVNSYARHLERTPAHPKTGKPSTKRSIARKLSAVSSWYGFLRKMGAIQVNPVDDADKPKIENNTEPRGFSEMDAAALIAAAAPTSASARCAPSPSSGPPRRPRHRAVPDHRRRRRLPRRRQHPRPPPDEGPQGSRPRRSRCRIRRRSSPSWRCSLTRSLLGGGRCGGHGRNAPQRGRRRRSPAPSTWTSPNASWNRCAPLLARAQRQGRVRADLVVRDLAAVVVMTLATVHPGGGAAADTRRCLALLLSGLRPSAEPLPATGRAS
ncbi:site-specific integrase [Nonomuraea terrae]|uniref:SbtR family transcriptional regulator n=1 Tax=Nonomuraea terrae TaxID=2530383 RepID=UPI001405041B|nr:site-specific integrase [Nonomuraea terrae]